jgi:hypothetical protein
MFILALLFRYLWQLYPSLWMCLLFWSAIAAGELQYIRNPSSKINWWSKMPVLVGASMNAIVTLANDGRMPYLGPQKAYSLWVMGTGKHLLFLCDRFDGWSLGDFFILSGIAIAVLFWLFRPKNPLN